MSQAQLKRKIAIDYLRKSKRYRISGNGRLLSISYRPRSSDGTAYQTARSAATLTALGNDPLVILQCLTARSCRAFVLGCRLPVSYHHVNWAVSRRTRPSESSYTILRLYSSADRDRIGRRTHDLRLGRLRTPPTRHARVGHTAVWAGVRCRLGRLWYSKVLLNTGGRYNPTTDTWTSTDFIDAPAPRDYHTAVWTGSEMIVWGGVNSTTGYLNSGGRYSPGTDSWAATSTTNAPEARETHTAVWTGTEMIVWGGAGANFLSTGGRYNPNTDSWTATSTTNAPIGRANHTAVWTGTEMIVWGGYYWDGNYHYFQSGGRYNPNTDSWVATSTNDAPTSRSIHTAVWTGGEMIVWGGYDGSSYWNTGGRYNPGTNSWTAANTTDAPAGRSNQRQSGAAVK